MKHKIYVMKPGAHDRIGTKIHGNKIDAPGEEHQIDQKINHEIAAPDTRSRIEEEILQAALPGMLSLFGLDRVSQFVICNQTLDPFAEHESASGTDFIRSGIFGLALVLAFGTGLVHGQQLYCHVTQIQNCKPALRRGWQWA